MRSSGDRPWPRSQAYSDRPAAGRAWFERTLPDQLTLGRPDQIAIVFGRRVNRCTPGRFHTKVINQGVEAAIQVHYRASKVKQYFKEGRAPDRDDLRRLRRKGFIQRIPHSQRYELTSEGRRLAVFFTKTYTRIVNPSLADLDPALPAEIARRTPLATVWRRFEHALQDKINHAAITA